MSSKMDVVARLIDSWKRRSTEDFLACLTEDIEYHYHMGSKPLSGKDKMRKFLANYGAAYDQRSWRITNHAENGELLLVEGHEELYDLKHDRMIQQPFMQAYEFRGELICRMRDYYDSANLQPPAAARGGS
jgi:limonene-1,2-epoxide hydrolase